MPLYSYALFCRNAADVLLSTSRDNISTTTNGTTFKRLYVSNKIKVLMVGKNQFICINVLFSYARPCTCPVHRLEHFHRDRLNDIHPNVHRCLPRITPSPPTVSPSPTIHPNDPIPPISLTLPLSDGVEGQVAGAVLHPYRPARPRCHRTSRWGRWT